MGRDEECYNHEPKCFALDSIMLSNPHGKITMFNPYHYYFDLKYWNALPCQTTVQCHSSHLVQINQNLIFYQFLLQQRCDVSNKYKIWKLPKPFRSNCSKKLFSYSVMFCKRKWGLLFAFRYIHICLQVSWLWWLCLSVRSHMSAIPSIATHQKSLSHSGQNIRTIIAGFVSVQP